VEVYFEMNNKKNLLFVLHILFDPDIFSILINAIYLINHSVTNELYSSFPLRQHPTNDEKGINLLICSNENTQNQLVGCFCSE
jgi:hypothetical protein